MNDQRLRGSKPWERESHGFAKVETILGARVFPDKKARLFWSKSVPNWSFLVKTAPKPRKTVPKRSKTTPVFGLLSRVARRSAPQTPLMGSQRGFFGRGEDAAAHSGLRRICARRSDLKLSALSHQRSARRERRPSPQPSPGGRAGLPPRYAGAGASGRRNHHVIDTIGGGYTTRVRYTRKRDASHPDRSKT